MDGFYPFLLFDGINVCKSVNINFKIKLSYNQSTQMRSKGKSKNAPPHAKHQPFNINISFNINPKNILHHELPAQHKFQQRISSQQLPLSARGKQNKHRKAEGDAGDGGATERTVRKGSGEVPGEGEMSKKQLQRIKKKFLNRINNMDITLALPEAEHKVQREEDDANQSSLMSARMVQYQNNPVKKSSESLQFNFNSISGKSKILTNNEPSKVLPIQTFKKSKYESKPFDKRMPFMTQSKEVKLASHFKGYSTFTDNKYSPDKYRRKKARALQGEVRKGKPKQENLQQKLDRFKLDMMKLALAYDESEVLKTKLSSEYYNNIRSREISKEVVDVQKINEVEEHEKSEEIKNYQAKQSPNQHTPQQQSQSFKHLKDVYQGLAKKKNLDEGGECTENIVEYYTQLTSEPKCIIDEPVDSSSEAYDSSSVISSQSEHEAVNPQAKPQEHKQQIQIQQFVKFLQQKLADSPQKHEIAKQLTSLLNQYNKKSGNCEEPEQQEPNKSVLAEHEAVIDEGMLIDNIDRQINRELLQIPFLKDKLMDNFGMEGDQVLQLEQWEENYKNELLKIKGKMWKEYKTIRNVIENRIISSPNNQKAIVTRKTKKHNKIMKCLSQKIFLKGQVNQNAPQTLEQLKKERTVQRLPKQKGFLIKQEHLFVEPSLSDENSDSRNDLEIMEGDPGFVPTSSQFLNSKNSEKDDSIIMSSLVKIQMEEKANEPPPQPISLQYHLTQEDKDDIFQFIFLDICIELYQEAIEKEEGGGVSAGAGATPAAIRILDAIKTHIKLQKKRKVQRENRKIGISTNVNVVKQTVEQITKFALSDLKINGSPLTNKQRITSKLSSPLGPSEIEILKSLRLSLFNNQPMDDYADDVEEADLLVLDPDLFLYFENQIIKIQQLPFSKYYDDEKRDQQRINFLRNCTHIHQKAIFDCLNENLDYHRAFGIWGRPFKWKKTPIFQHIITSNDLHSAMSKSGAEVVKCAAFVCGLMVQKEESLIKDIASDSSYVRRLQDERIYKLLENFVFEMEEKWFFHDDEEAEILVELSHIVWTLLIKEVLKELQCLLR